MIVESDGFQWLVDEHGVDGRLGPTNHEAELMPWFKGEGIFVDVGADVGRWSIRVAHMYDHVYALEPHPGRYARLLANVALNGLQNITVIPLAASHEVGFNKIGRIGVLGEGTESASLGRLDQMVTRADVVKLDIEGHEAFALQGMTGLLDHPPRLIIEMHHHLYGQQIMTDVQGWMDEHNYRFDQIAEINGQQYFEGRPK